jgi:nitroimidazol reductase NimA-like FMN-containing flavoprotein (pyridoxamine 5'-phosphate oxidase superfamily)
MATKQGDITLLNDPIAKELLESTIPARFAYVGSDGTPRVVPIWFHWNGKQVVLGIPLTAPKLKALAKNPKVALTIDTNGSALLTSRSAFRARLRGQCRANAKFLTGPRIAFSAL